MELDHFIDIYVQYKSTKISEKNEIKNEGRLKFILFCFHYLINSKTSLLIYKYFFLKKWQNKNCNQLLMGHKQSKHSQQSTHLNAQEEIQEQIEVKVEDGKQEELKKVIIVVGKMGHGKSSFVNTLILPKGIKTEGEIPNQMKSKLMKADNSIKSVRTQCDMGEVHESHNLLGGQKLYAIDTPGLNSDDAICLVSEQIDNIMIKKNCQIIGIAYVINMSGDRQIGGNQHSTIKQFMEVLKMKKQVKDKLLFCVLSNWDLMVQKKKDEIQTCLTEIQSIIRNIGVPNSDTKFIKWVNPICPHQISLNVFINHMGGNDVLTEQWIKLRQIISICQKYSRKPQDHLESMKNFWEKTLKVIFSQIKNNNKNKIQYHNEPTTIYFTQQLGVQKPKDIQKNNKKIIALQFVHRIMKEKFNYQITENLKLQIINKINQNVKISDDKITFIPFMDPQTVKKLDVNYVYKKKRIRICQLESQDMKAKHQIKFTITQANLDKQTLEQLHSPNYRLEQKVQMKGKKGVKGTKADRIPKKVKIYLEYESSKLKLYFDLECYLPKEECYYNIINESCVEMFGQYK